MDVDDTTVVYAGARPGKAACSFPQGVAEIVLRVMVAVVSTLLIITNGYVLGLDISYTPPPDSADNNSATVNSSSTGNSNGIDISILEKQTAAAGGLALVVGILGLLWESLALLLRYLNIGYLNLRAKIVLTIDVVVTFILALNSAVVLSVIFSPTWRQLSNGSRVYYTFTLSTALGLLASVFKVVLAIYMIVYIVKGWNKKVVNYTSLQFREDEPEDNKL